jgi:hypothetical protein
MNTEDQQYVVTATVRYANIRKAVSGPSSKYEAEIISQSMQLSPWIKKELKHFRVSKHPYKTKELK